MAAKYGILFHSPFTSTLSENSIQTYIYMADHSVYNIKPNASDSSKLDIVLASNVGTFRLPLQCAQTSIIDTTSLTSCFLLSPQGEIFFGVSLYTVLSSPPFLSSTTISAPAASSSSGHSSSEILMEKLVDLIKIKDDSANNLLLKGMQMSHLVTPGQTEILKRVNGIRFLMDNAIDHDAKFIPKSGTLSSTQLSLASAVEVSLLNFYDFADTKQPQLSNKEVQCAILLQFNRTGISFMVFTAHQRIKAVTVTVAMIDSALVYLKSFFDTNNMSQLGQCLQSLLMSYKSLFSTQVLLTTDGYDQHDR